MDCFWKEDFGLPWRSYGKAAREMKGRGGQISEALERAFRILAARSCSEAEIRLRLLRAGYGEQCVEEVLGKLRDYGYVDDARFAQDKVLALMHDKGFGRARIAYELKRRGVNAELIEEAIQSALDEASEEEIAFNVASKRVAGYSGLPVPLVRRRLYGFLMRRGFSHEIISRAIRRVLGD